jgi:rSAM/selenodomain-associated transferase 1
MSQTKALIMFAREPKLGEVKTRLAKSITAESVLALYEAFVKDVANLCQSVSCDVRYLYYYSDDGRVSFLKAFSDKFILMRQRGKDLGERLLNAFTDCEKGGYARTIIVGSDCLTMTSEDLRSAFNALEANDFVLGPCTDGGFYLIGAKKAAPEDVQRRQVGHRGRFQADAQEPQERQTLRLSDGREVRHRPHR